MPLSDLPAPPPDRCYPLFHPLIGSQALSGQVMISRVSIRVDERGKLWLDTHVYLFFPIIFLSMLHHILTYSAWLIIPITHTISRSSSISKRYPILSISNVLGWHWIHIEPLSFIFSSKLLLWSIFSTIKRLENLRIHGLIASYCLLDSSFGSCSLLVIDIMIE